MIWEINENLDGKVTWYEFELMYKRRTLNTDYWLEPSDLFYIVEFLMYLTKGYEEL